MIEWAPMIMAIASRLTDSGLSCGRLARRRKGGGRPPRLTTAFACEETRTESGDLREYGAFPVRLVPARAAARRRLQLLDALLHRESFLVGESLELLADRGGALGGLLRFLLWAHRNILMLI